MKEPSVFIVTYFDPSCFPPDEGIQGVFTTKVLALTEVNQIEQEGDYSACFEEWPVKNYVTPKGE